MQTSEVLNTAADHIEERGWVQGPAGWRVDATLCLEGGIHAALGTNFYVSDPEAFWGCPAYKAVASYLDRVPDAAGNCTIWSWNDTMGRTAAEVIEVLRACAVIEQSRERQPAEAVAS